MRTEVTAGQYLDLLRAAGGLPGAQGALTVARYKSAGYTVQRPLQLGAAIAGAGSRAAEVYTAIGLPLGEAFQLRDDILGDRKSTRLNSSHANISYAVFCLKKKK